MTDLEGKTIRRGPGRPKAVQTEALPSSYLDDRGDALPPNCVRARVMKKGDKRIYTGQTLQAGDPGFSEEPFPAYRKGDILVLARGTAEKYEEEFGWVEVLSDSDG